MIVNKDKKVGTEIVSFGVPTDQLLIQNKGTGLLTVFTNEHPDSGKYGFHIPSGWEIIFPTGVEVLGYSSTTTIVASADGKFEGETFVPVPVTSVVTDSNTTRLVGEKNYSQKYTVYPEDATITNVTNTSDDHEVVDIVDNQFVFLKAGNARLGVILTDALGNIVADNSYTSVEELYVRVDSTSAIIEGTPSPLPGYDSSPDISDKKIEWFEDSDENLLIIDESAGTYTGKSAGSTRIGLRISARGVVVEDSSYQEIKVSGTAPSITSQPPAQRLYQESGPLVISGANVSGNNVTISWQKSTDSGSTWTTVPDQASADLNISKATLAEGLYRLRAENDYGTAYSNNVEVVSVYLRIQNDAAASGTNSVEKVTNINYKLNSGPGTRYLSAFYTKTVDDSAFTPAGLTSGRAVVTWTSTNPSVVPNTPVSAGGQLTSVVKTGSATLIAMIDNLGSVLTCTIS